MGKKLEERLAELKDRHPSIGEVRSIGLFAAVELVKDRKTKEPLAPWNKPDPGIMARLNACLREKGVYVYQRWNCLVIAPPLSINDEELNLGLDTIDNCLELADRISS